MDHAFGLSIPITLDEVCDPDRTVLVVYDMQVGIVSQIPTGREVTGRVQRVLQAARDGGFRVFFTRHMSLPNELAGVVQLRTAMAWQRVDHAAKTRPAFLRDSPQFQLVPELTPSAGEAVFDKIAMSAFVGTPLDTALRDCGINSFVIVGIALEIGIEPTVRHAMDLGYIPIVVEDACGWGDAAAAERAKAQLAFVGGSLATDTDTIVGLLGRRRASSDG
ncbi:MAG TPA: cysteine hydrolase [Gemmatimonadales bacterium]|jgi:nicotinamidase-related amidase|nr:cysteine hydrolase [Gemmatimonadales bacterium]